jgi:hypothetical protein
MKRLKWSAAIAAAVSFLTVLVPAHVLDVKHGDGTFMAFTGLGYAALQQHAPVLPDLSPSQAAWALLGSIFTLALAIGLLRLYKLPWWLGKFAAGIVVGFFSTPAFLGWIAGNYPDSMQGPKAVGQREKFGVFDAGMVLGVLPGLCSMTAAALALGVALIKMAAPGLSTDAFSVLSVIPTWLYGAWAGFAVLTGLIGCILGSVERKKQPAEEAAKPSAPTVPATDAELEALGLKKDAEPSRQEPPKPKPAPVEETPDELLRTYKELAKRDPLWAHWFRAKVGTPAKDEQGQGKTYDPLPYPVSAVSELLGGLTDRKRKPSFVDLYPDEWSVVEDLGRDGWAREHLEAMLKRCVEKGWTYAAEMVRRRLDSSL